jgi:hypothetical protein
VASDLVAVPLVYLTAWMDLFRPVREQLRIEETLADLLMDTEEKQFAVLYPKVNNYGERSLPLLIEEIDRPEPRGDGGSQGTGGETPGECGRGIIEDGPGREGLAAASTQP